MPATIFHPEGSFRNLLASNHQVVPSACTSKSWRDNAIDQQRVGLIIRSAQARSRQATRETNLNTDHCRRALTERLSFVSCFCFYYGVYRLPFAGGSEDRGCGRSIGRDSQLSRDQRCGKPTNLHTLEALLRGKATPLPPKVIAK